MFNICYYVYSKTKRKSKLNINKYINAKRGDIMKLSKEAREARNEYMREWRRKNKDKVKKHQETYWERQAEKEAKQETK